MSAPVSGQPPIDPRGDTVLWALLFASIAGFMIAAAYFLGRYAR